MMLIGCCRPAWNLGGAGQRDPAQRGDHEEELREIAIFVTHYVGFPLGSKVDGAFKRVVAKRKKAEERGAARGQQGQRQRRRPDARGQTIHDK